MKRKPKIHILKNDSPPNTYTFDIWCNKPLGTWKKALGDDLVYRKRKIKIDWCRTCKMLYNAHCHPKKRIK